MDIVERGKPRQLCTLTFEDRIVQKLLNQFFLLPAFIPTLIYDNMASIRGRGPYLAMQRTEEFLKKVNF